MFKDSWGLFALVVVLLGVAARQEALLFMGALLVTSMVVARTWNRWALHRVAYRREFDESRVFAGETVGFTLDLLNNKPLPLLWLRVDDRFPREMPPVERPLAPSGIPEIGLLGHVTSLLWFQRVRWRYRLECPMRGFYFFGPAELYSGDLFGILASRAQLEGTTRLIVYPRVRPLERLGLPAKDPFGGKRVNLPVFEDPTRVVGTRDYHPDDPMRRVHWKATARASSLQVRVWEPAQEAHWMIFLNVATFPRHWQGINRHLLEWTISVAASLCQHAFDDRLPVGLIANASVPQSDQPVRVAPGRSPHQLRYILEALAAVTSFATSPIEHMLRVESAKAGWGATLIVVTSVVTEELEAQMVRLHRVGRKMALVSLDRKFDEERARVLEVQGIVVHRLPVALLEFAAHEEPLLPDNGPAELPAEITSEEEDPHALWKPPGASRKNGRGEQ